MMHKDFFIRNISQGSLCAAVRLLIISKKVRRNRPCIWQTHFYLLLSPLRCTQPLLLRRALRYGVMHRNTYLDSPRLLDRYYRLKSDPRIVFAGQMINYTIPGTGSSGHLCGGMLLSAMLGPWAGFLSMIVILAIQALFFADGGLLALGANVWNMAFYGCFVGYFLIYRPLMRGNLSAGKARLRLTLASVLGCVATLQLGAFSVVLETTLFGITALPLGAFAVLMQPIHLAIGLVEGLITAAGCRCASRVCRNYESCIAGLHTV